MTAHAFRHPVPLEGGDDLVARARDGRREAADLPRKRLMARYSGDAKHRCSSPLRPNSISNFPPGKRLDPFDAAPAWIATATRSPSF